MGPLRILIADDHDVVRRGLRSLLRTREDWDVCGEAADGQEAVEKARQLRPDVIVLDVSMPCMNGLEAARLIRNEVPQSEVLILTQHESREILNEAVSAGAKGYVVKSDISRDLLSAIETVGQHRPAYSSRVASPTEPKVAARENVTAELTEFGDRFDHSASTVTYRILAEAVPSLVFITDEEGDTIEANSRCANYIGLSASESGWRWTEFVHPEERDAAETASSDALKSHTVMESDNRLRGSDGTYRWHRVCLSPATPEILKTYWVGIATDIHDQRLAAEELQREQERLRIALEASDTGTFRWDPATGEFLQFGPILKCLFGLAKSHPMRCTEDFTRLVHPDDLPALKAAIEHSRQGADFELEHRVVLPDGAVRWLYDRAKMVRDPGGRSILMGACTDITRRKQAEEALQKAHDELDVRVRERTRELERKSTEVVEHARLLDLANDAIFVRSLDGTVFYWNEGAERLYGWNKHEVSFHTLGELLKTEFPIPFAQIVEILKRDGKWEGELVHTRRDGSRIVVASRWTVWRSPEGEPMGWLQINTDITERRRIEDGLRAMSARLLHLQDEERRRIARELHDSAGQLLVALKLNLAMAQNVVRAGGPEPAKVLNESIEFADQLSRELRTISHLLHPPLLDEAGLPSAIRWYVEGFAERSAIAVDLELPPDLGRLPRDLETAIFRIVQECLTNIHRHSGSNTAAIRITRNHEDIALQVRDRGKGMPVDRDRGSVPLKPGVGISGMRERVRQLGGRLEISSGRKGTSITATFPLGSSAVAHSAGAVPKSV